MIMKHMYDVVIPIITPFNDDDTIDVASLERLTEYLIDKGADCLYPCGSTGEMAYLTDEERMLVTETVVKKAAGRLPVFAQVGARTTESTIKLAQHAAACGADGIGVVTPWYYLLTNDELVNFYCEVSRSVPKDFPVYIYSIHQCAVNNVTAPLAERIAALCPNIIGIKYSYPDFTVMQDLMNVRGGDFDMLVGPDHLYEPIMAMGGQGVISGNAQVVIEHYVAIREAIKANDWKLAARLQKRTNELNAILCAKSNMNCYKIMLKELGVIKSSRMRRPLIELSEDEQVQLIARLKAEGFQTVAVQ